MLWVGKYNSHVYVPAPGDLTVNMLSACIRLVGEDLDTGYNLRSPECPLLPSQQLLMKKAEDTTQVKSFKKI